MTLQDLGSVGEFLGGLAVLVSLIYLALQIRQNTTSVRAATSASVSESLSRFTETLISQPELARLWFQGISNYDSLEDQARNQFGMALLTYMRRVENAFYQHARGFVDPDHWQTTERILTRSMSRPGVLRWWSESKPLFSDRFVEFVERHIPKAPAA